jgi:hypothetical protein
MTQPAFADIARATKLTALHADGVNTLDSMRCGWRKRTAPWLTILLSTGRLLEFANNAAQRPETHDMPVPLGTVHMLLLTDNGA